MYTKVAIAGAIASGLCWGLGLGHRMGGLLSLAGAVGFVYAMGAPAIQRSILGLAIGILTCGLWFWELPEIWNTWGSGQGRALWALTTLVHSVPFAIMALCAGDVGTHELRPTLARLGLAGCMATALVSWWPIPIDLSMNAAFQPVLLGPARWFGAPGWVGWLLVLAGLLYRKHPASAVLMTVWMLLGLPQPQGPNNGRAIHATVIEPGLDVFGSRQRARRESTDRRVQEVLDGIPPGSTDLVVLSETAWSSQSPPQHAVPVVYGTARGAQNLLVLGEQHFAKQYLVPVVERPFLGLGHRVFTPGTAPRILDTGSLRLGPLVCFEDLHAQALRQAHREGAEILVVATQDSWLSIGRAASKHLAVSVLAAVRSGLPVIRAASTGPSAFISSSGHIRQSTAMQLTPVPNLRRIGTSLRLSGSSRAAVNLEPWLGGLSLLLLLGLWGRSHED